MSDEAMDEANDLASRLAADPSVPGLLPSEVTRLRDLVEMMVRTIRTEPDRHDASSDTLDEAVRLMRAIANGDHYSYIQYTSGDRGTGPSVKLRGSNNGVLYECVVPFIADRTPSDEIWRCVHELRARAIVAIEEQEARKTTVAFEIDSHIARLRASLGDSK